MENTYILKESMKDEKLVIVADRCWLDIRCPPKLFQLSTPQLDMGEK